MNELEHVIKDIKKTQHHDVELFGLSLPDLLNPTKYCFTISLFNASYLPFCPITYLSKTSVLESNLFKNN